LQQLSFIRANRMRIGSIVIHCHEFDRMVTFWQNALHYVPRRPAKDGWVVLRDPDRKGPNLVVPTAEETKKRRPRRNWMHLDLYTKEQEEEVNRLLQLGARGAIHGGVAPVLISSFWRTRTAIFSAWYNCLSSTNLFRVSQ
jgi:hypothetical protein